MKKDVKVVLFDLDGTIIDTEPLHYKCWNAILNSFNNKITYADYLDKYAGVAIDENCRGFINNYNLPATIPELRMKKEMLMLNYLVQEPLSPITFVNEMINLLQNQGICLGLVTSSSKEETNIILHKLNLNAAFDCVITRDDVVHKKPHPEPYFLAKAKFNQPNENFVVLEDSVSGIRSAKLAGLPCYAFYSGTSEKSNVPDIADGVFRNFDDLKSILITQCQIKAY